jgi:hypothetical protein
LVFGDPRNVDALHFPMVLAAMETDKANKALFMEKPQKWGVYTEMGTYW